MKATRRFVSSAAGAAALIAGSLMPAVPAHAQHAHHAGDSAAVAAVVQRYHQALAEGDSVAALALLEDDVVVLESGGIETREEYRAQHVQADIAFARAVRTERGPIRVTVYGDVAWAASTSRTTGRFRDRDINSAGAELMVLSRTADGWRIRAIHWSSRTIRS